MSKEVNQGQQPQEEPSRDQGKTQLPCACGCGCTPPVKGNKAE
jgi:hypothetical protein